MKTLLITFSLTLMLILPLTTQANPFGQIIYRHPGNDLNELWITDLANTKDARMIFKHDNTISTSDLAVANHHILFVSRMIGEEISQLDLFYIDARQPHAKARNITQGSIDHLWEFDLSDNGDIVMTNSHFGEGKGRLPKGIHLITSETLMKDEPIITTLKEDGIVYGIVWSPDGEQIAYHENNEGIFTLDVATRETALIHRDARYPAYSPDGKKLAFIYRSLFDPQDLRIISLETMEVEQIIKLDDRQGLKNVKWTPDGQCLIYETSNRTYAVPIADGEHIVLFEEFDRAPSSFDWASDAAYSVEPTSRHLTTLWGKMKR